MNLLGIAVIYYNGKKISIEHGSILPDYVILDGNVLKTLPDYQKKSTLLDSLCQAIESYWAKDATSESKKYSKQCILLILKNYKNYIENKSISYKKILYASNYSGKAINISKTTSAHAMSYKITTKYNISHGHAVAICIIPVWKLLSEKSERNPHLKDVLLEIASIFEKNTIKDSINYFEEIVRKFDLPNIHIKENDLLELVDSVNIERMENNPIIFNKQEILDLYKSINK